MSTLRTICTGIATFGMVAGIAYAAPQVKKLSKGATMRIGSPNNGATSRGGGIVLCDPS